MKRRPSHHDGNDRGDEGRRNRRIAIYIFQAFPQQVGSGVKKLHGRSDELDESGELLSVRVPHGADGVTSSAKYAFQYQFVDRW